MKQSDIHEAYRLHQILEIIQKLESSINSGTVPLENVEFPIRVDERDVIPLIVPVAFVQECMLNPLKKIVSDSLVDLGVEIEEETNASGTASV